MKKEIIITNYLWQLSEKFLTQIIEVVIQLILARILGPDDYGIVALVSVFMNIVQVLVDGGFASALIQKKDADDIDFSTVFYYNIAFCFGLYILLFIFAPNIAVFYNQPVLTALTRVLGIKIIISGIKNVQQAYVARNMIFERFFYASLSGTVIAAVLSLWMAFNGFGVWSLVAMNLCDALVDTAVIWFTVPWRPQNVFDCNRLKKLFRFGSKLLFSDLLADIYKELRQLLIGKWYSPTDLAFFNKARMFPSTIINDISTSLGTILFPVMSAEQSNTKQVRSHVRRAIQIMSYIIYPMMTGLICCAEPLVFLILGEKWSPSIPFIQIFSLELSYLPLATTCQSAYKSLGRSDIHATLQTIKIANGILIMLITLPMGMMALAQGLIVSNVINFCFNSIANKKLLNYRVLEMIHDIAPAILLSIFMGGCIWFIPRVGLSHLLTLVIQVLCGTTIYLGISALLRLESFCFIFDCVKNIFPRRKK